MIFAAPMCYRLAANAMRSPRKPILLFALFGMVVVVPALAQPGQPVAAYPPACGEAKVSKSDRDRAHTVFLSGKQFLEESNYDKAIGYFNDAYTIDCSVHGILPIIATAYERKGDKREAVRALEEYLRRAPAAPDHDVVERRIKNLKEQIGQEPSPMAPPSATATTLGPTASTAPAVSAVPPPESGPVAVASSGALAPPPSEAGHSAAPWVLVGLGGAAIAGGVVLLAVGASDISSADSACPSRTQCAKSVADQGNMGRTLEPVGYIVGGAGLAAVVGGLIWHFVEKPSSTPAAMTVAPVAAPSYAGVSLGGTF